MEPVKRDPYKLVGTKLDRYLIQEVAGGGGMGVVYRAQHEITKGVVAIKVLRPDSPLNNDAGVSMFFEEAVKTVSLNHPAIVKVIGADYTPDGLAFMVMEWLDGLTLSDELYRQQVLPIERVADLLDQICNAVAFAHGKNIIHRDLKPGNIMLVTDGSGEETIRVLDFGIAKAMDNTVGTNTRIAGSYYYISPEQTVAQGRIDRCTDIYSLGVMLYQMLTGKVPFEANTDGQIIDMHRSLDPLPLRQVNPDIPLGIEEVVLKALAKQAGDRYQTATELARAFRHAAQLASGAIILECSDEHDGSPVATAAIYLNGKHAGQTDVNGRWQQNGLTPKKYMVEVEAPRYERWHLSENLAAREEITIPAKLKRQPKGELVISCGVAGVEVEFDGAKVGKTDSTGRLYLESVNAGSHTLRLTHSQYLPLESNIEIAVWQQALAALTLTERPRRQFGKQLWQKVKGASDTLTDKFRSTTPIESGVVKLSLEEPAPPPTSEPFDATAPTELLKDAPVPAAAAPDVYATLVEMPQGIAPEPETPLRSCDQCGNQLPITLRFCTECGAALTSKPAESSDPPTDNAPSLSAETASPATQEESPRQPEKEPSPSISEYETMPLTSEALPYVTLTAPRTAKSGHKKLWIGVACVLAGLAGIAAWIITSATPEVSEPTSFDLMLRISPLESQVTIDSQSAQTTDSTGTLKLSGLIAGQTIVVRKPCYEPETLTAQPSDKSAVEITLRKQTREGMVCLPGGKLSFGRRDASGKESVETVELTLPPFWMDVTEVTRGQYARFLKENPSSRKPEWWNDGNLSDEQALLPANDIRWSDAQAYALHYGKRLPTEAEWEFAARGGNQDRLYSWGDGFDQEKANTGGKPKLVAVTQFSPNEFGLFGLTGNVWEWTEDQFDGNPHPRNPACPECKILRGGSYLDSPENSSNYFRYPFRPESGRNYSGIGFRCVSQLPQ